MNSTTHPSVVLKQKYTDIIRDSATRAEKDGRLTKTQLGLIYEQQWFKMLAPSSLGGLQTPLPETLRVAEALAWADGGLGWQVAMAAGASWSAGFADAETVQKLLGDQKACIAATTAASGTAEKTKGGYTINGKWPQITGAQDATSFEVSCVLVKNGQPVKNDAGTEPQLLSFYLSKDEVSLTPAGNLVGLAAAEIQNLEVKHLEVAAARAFKVQNDAVKIDAPLYKFPYLQLMESLLAVNISGMAVHFIDLCDAVFAEQKNRSGVSLADDRTVQEILAKQILKLEDARTKLSYAIDISWQSSVNFRQIKPAILYKISAASYELSRRAIDCVDTLLPFCGVAGVDKATAINKVWRDIHTAGQNELLVFGSLPE